MTEVAKAQEGYLTPWFSLYALSGAVIGILGTFLLPPPYLYSSLPLAQFLTAILIGLAMIPAILFKKRATLRYWICTTLFIFAASLGCLALYWHDLDHLTLPFETGRVVIGEHMLPEAQKELLREEKREGHIVTDSMFIKDSSGLTDSIWPNAELTGNSERLELEYLGAVACFGIVIVCLLQSIAIAGVVIPKIKE